VRWLESKSIRYRKVDVSTDDQALEKVKAMGYLQVPVVVVPFDRPNGGAHWSGFNPIELGKLL
jgi:glutaredoxin-like protein NrdH